MSTTLTPSPRLMGRSLAAVDPEIAAAVDAEFARQRDGLELIASENYASRAVLEATGSVLTNKYAEGYPGRRYYGGCENVDVAESLAIARAKKLFSPGTPTPFTRTSSPTPARRRTRRVYLACLKPGDTILGMSLAHGGHLTHGHPLSISGKLYRVVSYGVTRETETIDYDELARIAEAEKPKLIIAGASAYPRILDFPRFRQVADSVGALLMVDMAHIAGLVATGLHPSPVGHAHFVTTTTHKTLRGPRGGLVLCTPEWAQGDRQGGLPGPPGRAARARHRRQGRVVPRGAARPSSRRTSRPSSTTRRPSRPRSPRSGFRIVSGGTDNHLFLVDLGAEEADGKGGGEGARPRRDHGQQERDPVRPEPADGDLGPAPRNAGRDDARNGARRDEDDRRLDRRGPRRAGGRRREGGGEGEGQGADRGLSDLLDSGAGGVDR